MFEPSEERRDKLAIVFSNVGHTYTHMFTVLYATAVLYLPKVFGLTYGELLGLSSFGLVLFGVAAVPAGWLADRWSRVGMMVVFFIGLGAGAILTGLADGTATLWLGLTLIGLFAAIYHPVGIAWIVASAKRQGMSLGINGVFGNVGNGLAPIFVGLMMDYVDWRAAFILPGILSMASGIVLFVAWKRGLVGDATADRAPAAPTDGGAMVRVFFILTVTMACTGFVYAGISNTMPKLFEGGLGPAMAGDYTRIGLFVGVVSGLSSFASIAGGWLADRFSARVIYVVFWLLQVPLLFIVVDLSGGSLLLATFLMVSFNLTFTAAENMLVANYTPFRWRALAYGAKFVVALGVGGLTVLLAGRMYDAQGSFDLLYSLFAIAAILAAFIALFLPGRRRPEPVPAAAE